MKGLLPGAEHHVARGQDQDQEVNAGDQESASRARSDLVRVMARFTGQRGDSTSFRNQEGATHGYHHDERGKTQDNPRLAPREILADNQGDSRDEKNDPRWCKERLADGLSVERETIDDGIGTRRSHSRRDHLKRERRSDPGRGRQEMDGQQKLGKAHSRDGSPGVGA